MEPGARPSRFAPLPVVVPAGSPGAGTVVAAQPARRPATLSRITIRARRTDRAGRSPPRDPVGRLNGGGGVSPSSERGCIDPTSMESVAWGNRDDLSDRLAGGAR